MKFATLKNNTRDGQLVIVSQDLTRCRAVPEFAETMQQALDHWHTLYNRLEDAYESLNQEVEQGSEENSQVFDPQKCKSPLPRAYQWVDGSAYVNHVELVRKARGAEMPESFWTDPLMYQGGSDAFIGPCSDIWVADEKYGIDFESEIALITDDVPMGVEEPKASRHICLFMLCNDVSLRNLIPNELAKGFGFFQSKPASSFSPVAVTPDELQSAWDGLKIHLPLITSLNGELFGKPNAGIDMTFDFPTLISHAAKTRSLTAGTVIGSGTVSNYDRSAGSSCLAEKRMLEIVNDGKASTPFMKFGDRVRIEMLDNNGRSIFGAIDQQVIEYKGANDAL